MIEWWDLLLRLLAAAFFAGAVGLQRELSGKAAGMRTHMLVGIGSATFTAVSSLIAGATAGDPGRITSQIVTGIGFIGGGAILKERGSVKGLTTAAGLWTVAALGMAAGAGYYLLGAIATLICLITLITFRQIEARLHRRLHDQWVIDLTLTSSQQLASLRAILTPQCRTIALSGLQSGDHLIVSYTIELVQRVDLPALTDQLRTAGALHVTWTPTGNIEEKR